MNEDHCNQRNEYTHSHPLIWVEQRKTRLIFSIEFHEWDILNTSIHVTLNRWWFFFSIYFIALRIPICYYLLLGHSSLKMYLYFNPMQEKLDFKMNSIIIYIEQWFSVHNFPFRQFNWKENRNHSEEMR